MRWTSLVPFRESGTLMRPGFGLFGLHREIDHLFNKFAQAAGLSGGSALPQAAGLSGGSATLIPSVDICETDKAIEVTAEMPGLERKDVQVSIEDDTLTIRGEKKVEEDQEDENVQQRERSYGEFLRVLQLPPGIDPSSVEATMSNGVLKITVPKPAHLQPKKIEVKEAAQERANQAA